MSDEANPEEGAEEVVEDTAAETPAETPNTDSEESTESNLPGAHIPEESVSFDRELYECGPEVTGWKDVHPGKVYAIEEEGDIVESVVVRMRFQQAEGEPPGTPDPDKVTYCEVQTISGGFRKILDFSQLTGGLD